MSTAANAVVSPQRTTTPPKFHEPLLKSVRDSLSLATEIFKMDPDFDFPRDPVENLRRFTQSVPDDPLFQTGRLWPAGGLFFWGVGEGKREERRREAAHGTSPAPTHSYHRRLVN